MAWGFASVLDECIAALQRGATLEDCLARHPDHADQLRANLTLARKLQQTPRHQPRPAVQAAAWQRFRARAEDIRSGRRGLSLSIPALGWMRPLAIAGAAVIALTTVGLGGTVYAAEKSTPDSPLYRVKLLADDARLWVVLDDSRKAEILLDQANDRSDDVVALLGNGDTIPGNVLTDLHQRSARAVRILEDQPQEQALLERANEEAAAHELLLLGLWGSLDVSAHDDYSAAVATLHNARLRTAGLDGSVTPRDVAAGVISISGTAEPSAEGLWVLGGVEVKLDSRTLGQAGLTSGGTVKIVAAKGADGRLLALTVLVRDSQPEQGYVVSGALEDIGRDEVVVAGQHIAITEQTLLKLKLLLGRQVEIGVDDVDGQAVASVIEASSDGAQTEAPLLAYEGIIDEDIDIGESTSNWVVGGRSFVVTPETELDAGSGALTRGARAHVEAVARNGKIVAKRITVLRDTTEQTTRVEGLLEAQNGDTWTVSGVEMKPPEGVSPPPLGSLVTIELQGEGKSLAAHRLLATFAPDRDGFVLLRGRLNAIDDSGWRVGFAEAAVDSGTVVLGEPTEGSRVFIWARQTEDGSLYAVYATILDR